MHTTTNVLSYLEKSAKKTPRVTAVIHKHTSLTYAELLELSKRIGTALLNKGIRGRAVVVAMEKSCETLATMMGALYAGGYYVPIDPSVPEKRMERILDALDWPLVVADSSSSNLPSYLEWYDNTVDVSELRAHSINEEALADVRQTVLENDSAYVLFTSGSTGIPKGVAISHRAIACFIEAFVGVLGIRPGDRIGNQAPFDFDVSTKDIYSAFATGATLVIVPREYFMQPTTLMQYLAQERVTVLIWAVAAVCIVSSYHAFDQTPLPDLRVVAFSGEVMPRKHLLEWRTNAPQAAFFNLYGPTEITCNCLYHKLDKERSYEEGIPLGTAFPHCEVLIVDDENNEVTEPDVRGEIIVRGPSLALGYVGAVESTRRAFTQNPLHSHYPDRVYHTGDLASYSKEGELFFHGRKDNQVKHMGHRIELEEIDHVVEQMPGVRRCRSAYDQRRKRLRALVEGDATEREVRRFVATRLPIHMRPSTIHKVTSMPLNKNGKVDRAQLLDDAR